MRRRSLTQPRIRPVCLAASLALAAALCLTTHSPASVRPERIHAVIACYHPKISRYTAEPRPERCVFAGERGEGRRFAAVAVRGMEWSKWGGRPAYGSLGAEVGDGRRVRVVAYHLVACADGRDWYTRVVFMDLHNGHTFVLRKLPTCESGFVPDHRGS